MDVLCRAIARRLRIVGQVFKSVVERPKRRLGYRFFLDLKPQSPVLRQIHRFVGHQNLTIEMSEKRCHGQKFSFGLSLQAGNDGNQDADWREVRARLKLG